MSGYFETSIADSYLLVKIVGSALLAMSKATIFV